MQVHEEPHQKHQKLSKVGCAGYNFALVIDTHLLLHVLSIMVVAAGSICLSLGITRYPHTAVPSRERFSGLRLDISRKDSAGWMIGCYREWSCPKNAPVTDGVRRKGLSKQFQTQGLFLSWIGSNSQYLRVIPITKTSKSTQSIFRLSFVYLSVLHRYHDLSMILASQLSESECRDPPFQCHAMVGLRTARSASKDHSAVHRHLARDFRHLAAVHL